MAVKQRQAVSDTRAYHFSEKDASMSTEVSLSHYLRSPNSLVLGGRAYGQALAEFIVSQGLLPEKAVVCEVGGGLGHVAYEAVRHFSRHCRNLAWISFDASPALLAEQKDRLRPFDGKMGLQFLQGDAEKMDSIIGGADLVISNEAVGDFRVISHVPLTKNGKPSGSYMGPVKRGDERAWEIAWRTVDRYGFKVPAEGGIDDAGFAVEHGLVRFIESLSRIIKPSGAAVIIEHTHDPPKRLPLGDHDEYSLSPDQLTKTAVSNGFSVKEGSVNEFLGIPEDVVIVNPFVVNRLAFYHQQPELEGLHPIDIAHELGCNPRLSGEMSNRWKAWVRQNRIFDSFMRPHEAVAEGIIDEKSLEQEQAATRPISDIVSQFHYFILRRPPAIDILPLELHEVGMRNKKKQTTT